MRQLQTNDSYSMLTDASGYIWVKHRNSLYKLAKGGRQLLDEWKFTPLINQLYEDKNSRLWIGASTGLYVMNLYMMDATPEYFTDGMRDITYMQQETTEMLWVGTKKAFIHLTSPVVR